MLGRGLFWRDVLGGGVFSGGFFGGGNSEVLKGEIGGSWKSLGILFGLLFMAGEAGTDWDLFFFFFTGLSPPYLDQLVFPFW